MLCMANHASAKKDLDRTKPEILLILNVYPNLETL